LMSVCPCIMLEPTLISVSPYIILEPLWCLCQISIWLMK
jgi:hypothetical protein